MFPGATDKRGAGDAAGQTADSADANFVVVGAPLDVSTTFQPGTRFGPRRIRSFAAPFDDYDYRTDQHFSDLASSTAATSTRGTTFPSTSSGSREHFATPSGTTHPARFGWRTHRFTRGRPRCRTGGVRLSGRPPRPVRRLRRQSALARGRYSPHSRGCRLRRGGRYPWCPDGSELEWERADADDVTVVSPETVAAPSFALDDVVDLEARSTYLSVDIDAADPAYAPGTGTTEPFGLEAREMRDIVRAVAPHASGFDVVEVNDRDDGQAASLAGKLLREFVFSAGATAQTQ